MATLIIRELDDTTKSRLRIRAAHHGRSMEEEARTILRTAPAHSGPVRESLAESVRRRFAVLGGVDLDLPKRDAIRPVLRLSK